LFARIAYSGLVTRLALGSKLPLEFECMGEQEVKNIAEPVMAYRAASQGSTVHTAAQHKQTPAILAKKPSVAVLPFVNMSDDAEQEYFSDGITEDIITGLSRFRELCVIARGSSFAFKDKLVDVTEAAKQLGVQVCARGQCAKEQPGCELRPSLSTVKLEIIFGPRTMTVCLRTFLRFRTMSHRR